MRFLPPPRRKVPWAHQSVEIQVLGWLCSLSPRVGDASLWGNHSDLTAGVFLFPWIYCPFLWRHVTAGYGKQGSHPSLDNTGSVAQCPLQGRALLFSRMWRLDGKFLHAQIRDLESNFFQQALRGNIPISCHPMPPFPPEEVSSKTDTRKLFKELSIVVLVNTESYQMERKN